MKFSRTVFLFVKLVYFCFFMSYLDLFEEYCRYHRFDYQALKAKLENKSLSKEEFLEKIRQLLAEKPVPVDILSKYQPNIQLGSQFRLLSLLCQQKWTSAPKRFSAATLIKKLEELGIGRPSTYATIISTLEERGYVETQNKSLKPTPLGLKVSQVLEDNFPQIVSSQLTADMEEKLDKIANNQEEYEQVLSNFWQPLKTQIQVKMQEVQSKKDIYRTTEVKEICPECQAQMVLKIGQYGEYFQCLQNSKHQFPKNFREYKQILDQAYQLFQTQTFGKKCALCQKDLVVRVSKSTLNPYIACPDYKVGNKHTVMQVHYGECPECQACKRSGVLLKKISKKSKQAFLVCSLYPDCQYKENFSLDRLLGKLVLGKNEQN